MASFREIVYNAAKARGLTPAQVRNATHAQIVALAGTRDGYAWQAIRKSVANHLKLEKDIVQEVSDAARLQTKLRTIPKFANVQVIPIRPTAVVPPLSEVVIEPRIGDWIVRFP